jgi:WD40 repeat protein
VCRHAPVGGAAAADLTCVEWSPDGQQLATGATDNAVRLFGREGGWARPMVSGGAERVRRNSALTGGSHGYPLPWLSRQRPALIDMRASACPALSCRTAQVDAAGAPRHDHGGALEQEGRPAAVRWGRGTAAGWAGAGAAALVLVAYVTRQQQSAAGITLLITSMASPSCSPPAGSLDGTLIVWDAKAGSQHKQYAHHTASVVDADWRNNTMFASCSQDGSIAVCKLSDSKPLRHWQVGAGAAVLGQSGLRTCSLPASSLPACSLLVSASLMTLLPLPALPALPSFPPRRARTPPTSTACVGSPLESCWPPAATMAASRSGRRLLRSQCTRLQVCCRWQLQVCCWLFACHGGSAACCTG